MRSPPSPTFPIRRNRLLRTRVRHRQPVDVHHRRAAFEDGDGAVDVAHLFIGRVLDIEGDAAFPLHRNARVAEITDQRFGALRLIGGSVGRRQHEDRIALHAAGHFHRNKSSRVALSETGTPSRKRRTPSTGQ